MSAWIWVPTRACVIFHDRQIARHGGAPGIRDIALLEAACARPINQAGYGDPDVFDLAAAYAFGIAKAHAFIDGNKRTALVTALTFLSLNHANRRPDPLDAVQTIEDLAAGVISEADYADWLRGM